MKLAFVNLSDPKQTVVGDSSVELVCQLYGVHIDRVNRRAVILGVADTVTFSNEYSEEELPRAIAARVIELYTRRGWKLYKS